MDASVSARIFFPKSKIARDAHAKISAAKTCARDAHASQDACRQGGVVVGPAAGVKRATAVAPVTETQLRCAWWKGVPQQGAGARQPFGLQRLYAGPGARARTAVLRAVTVWLTCKNGKNLLKHKTPCFTRVARCYSQKQTHTYTYTPHTRLSMPCCHSIQKVGPRHGCVSR